MYMCVTYTPCFQFQLAASVLLLLSAAGCHALHHSARLAGGSDCRESKSKSMSKSKSESEGDHENDKQ